MSSSLFTRTEKSASLFVRITGLVRGSKLDWANRPLWYDVYAAHPPFDEPTWNLKMPKHDEAVRKIFYQEDIQRAEEMKKKMLEFKNKKSFKKIVK